MLGISGAIVGDLELVADEFVANAILHGSRPVWLRLAITDDGVSLTLDVYDTARVTPQLHEALAQDKPPTLDTSVGDGVLEEHGRGLGLVLGLAERVAVLPSPPGRPGKTVRAAFGCADQVFDRQRCRSVGRLG